VAVVIESNNSGGNRNIGGDDSAAVESSAIFDIAVSDVKGEAVIAQSLATTEIIDVTVEATTAVAETYQTNNNASSLNEDGIDDGKADMLV
jgi:hypothetical protein